MSKYWVQLKSQLWTHHNPPKLPKHHISKTKLVISVLFTLKYIYIKKLGQFNHFPRTRYIFRQKLEGKNQAVKSFFFQQKYCNFSKKIVKICELLKNIITHIVFRFQVILTILRHSIILILFSVIFPLDKTIGKICFG